MESKLILSSVDKGIKYPCIMQHNRYGTVAIWHSNTSGVVLVASTKPHQGLCNMHTQVGVKFAQMNDHYDPSRYWSPLPTGSQILITV